MPFRSALPHMAAGGPVVGPRVLNRLTAALDTLEGHMLWHAAAVKLPFLQANPPPGPSLLHMVWVGVERLGSFLPFCFLLSTHLWT